MQFQDLIAACLLWVSAVAAQSIIRPSNVSANASEWSNTGLFLSFKQEGALMTFGVDDALNPWPSNSDTSEGTMISGNICLSNTSSVQNLTAGDIVYMSCEPSNYTGNLQADGLFNLAYPKINGGQSGGNNAGAIVLYSTFSAWCNFTPPASLTYKNVFILPMQAPARHLEDILKAPNTSVLRGQILQNASSSSNNTGPFQASDDLGPTPTTTVAMIILYSVTGIITLCFIVVIVTGAVRAHRHPDRYGLLNLPGGAHQRRARGIARAMLDTIPIVKFGEREPSKPTDPEHGTELHDRAGEASPDAQHTRTADTAGNAHVLEGSNESQNSEGSEATSAQQQSHSADDAVEVGLTCSVCTDDFVRGQDTRVLPCNHKFHPECIDPWLLNVSGTCPLCRSDLNPPENGSQSPETEGFAPGPQMGPGGIPVYRPLRLAKLLHPRRMRNATPEQRIQALREVRDAGRGGIDGNDSEPTRPPRIRGTRLTRLFRRETNSATDPSESNAVPQPEQFSEHQPTLTTEDVNRTTGGEAQASRS